MGEKNPQGNELNGLSLKCLGKGCHVKGLTILKYVLMRKQNTGFSYHTLLHVELTRLAF